MAGGRTLYWILLLLLKKLARSHAQGQLNETTEMGKLQGNQEIAVL